MLQINPIKAGLHYFRHYMTIPSSPQKPQLAFLGPVGTYSHQAAFEYFGNSVEYIAQPTIADVRQALTVNMPFGIIPQENSTNGTVIETYNDLRFPAVGQEVFVRGVTVFEVKHSLVSRQGVKLKDIEKILSHEQALGQCRAWLAKHIPRASLVSTDSTASAAEMLVSTESGLDPMRSAAICSSMVITIYEGLEVLKEGIQDESLNFTRFYILSRGLDVALPGRCSTSPQNMALLRLQSPPSDSMKRLLNIPRTIGSFDINILRIDRRPSLCTKPFDDVYFLEVGAIPADNCPELSWRVQLQQVVDKVKGMGVEASILGSW